ncbi:YciI family protein [Pectobacterium versatile]|uniref:YciI family protein n=1 Tax=Pectobacterium versatile TaxID=2488639 RepID=UPI001CCCBA64|nr:YciI family protein [Pectobacterium versatile]
MYIINITVNTDVSSEQHGTLFPKHVEWFKKYFDAGKFLVIGPYADREHSGVIIAQTKNRNELETILHEDSYYPNQAEYEIREFTPKMIAANVQNHQAE